MLLGCEALAAPPACPHPKESLVPPEPGQHTPLTPLWEAFPSQPHPALTTAYSASPWQLDQSFPCVQLSLVYVLLCKHSQKASYSTVITSCESLSLLIKPVLPGYESLPYRSAKKSSRIEVTSLFLQLVSLEKQRNSQKSAASPQVQVPALIAREAPHKVASEQESPGRTWQGSALPQGKLLPPEHCKPSETRFPLPGCWSQAECSCCVPTTTTPRSAVRCKDNLAWY